MNNDINILNDKFLQVKKLNWIKATSKGNGNVGITFENAIGKERENFPIADYNGIEIKTSLNKNTRPYITLFSATPDGPYIFGTQTLKEKYGWTSPKLKGYKVFYARVNGKKLKKINNKYFMKINVDYNNEKLNSYFNLNNDINISDEDFEKLLGRKLNPINIKASKPYNLNNNLADLLHEQAAKDFYNKLLIGLNEMFKDDKTDTKKMFESMMLETPLRSLYTMSGGLIKRDDIEKLLYELNN